MGLIYDELLRFLREDEWPIHEIGDGITISTAFDGEAGRCACVGQAIEDGAVCIFYSIGPLEAPEERRDAIGRWLAEASYGTFLGGFEMDGEDGDIRFKTSLCLAEMPLDEMQKNGTLLGLIKAMVYANVLTMDAHLPDLTAVVEGREPNPAP